MRNVVIAKVPGMFCGWPANAGLARCWNSEITVPFWMAAFAARGAGQHAADFSKQESLYQARSLDGGETWELEHTGFNRPMRRAFLDFANPSKLPFEWTKDTVAAVMYESCHRGTSGLRISQDRGRSWLLPLVKIDLGRDVCGRTDYLPVDRGLLLMLTVSSGINSSAARKREGRVIAALLHDDWSCSFLANVGRDPYNGFSIMPSTVREQDGRLVSALRVLDQDSAKIEIHAGNQSGTDWCYVSSPVEQSRKTGVRDVGAVSCPGALLALRDGRLCLTYVDRRERRAMACLSRDRGLTWEHLTIQAGAGNWDIGYPRAVEMPNGEVLSAYYWNDSPDTERYISGTIWRP